MSSEIPLSFQTAYAELLDRAAGAAFVSAFAEDGAFTAKTVRGKRYWYFQTGATAGRRQLYVGPETPELVERIERHREARNDQRERQALVSMLVRSANLPRPLPRLGNIVAALADAGVFRLRGVLIGTVAYQAYSAMLGVRLAGRAVQTSDVDVAQFADVSVAVGDRIAPILETLKRADRSFREVPHLRNPLRATTYAASGGIRVDFLTPNRGPDTDAPRPLPAFGTHAQPLRFLDFLIRDPEPAMVLHGAGVYVAVPAPQRFALHKLIVARRRPAGSAKSDKDLKQAEALLEVLARKREHELRTAWREAFARGKAWQRLLGEGLGLIHPDIRDRTLAAAETSRSVIPGLDLRFAAPVARYEADRDVVTFLGEAGGAHVRCAVSGEALEDNFRADRMDRNGQLRVFRENRAILENLARLKYLTWPVEQPGAVLLESTDVPRLLVSASKGRARSSRV